MATNILSSLMSSAQGYASSAMRSSAAGRGGEGKDPNIAAILAQGKKLADEQNVTGLEAIQDEFKSLGLGPTYQVLLKSARTPTPGQQTNQAIGNFIGDAVLQKFGIGGQQQQQPQTTPTSNEQPAPLSRLDFSGAPEGFKAQFTTGPDGKTSSQYTFTAPERGQKTKRLEELKSLLDTKQITDSEYRLMRKGVIGGALHIERIDDPQTGETLIQFYNEYGNLANEHTVKYSKKDRDMEAWQFPDGSIHKIAKDDTTISIPPGSFKLGVGPTSGVEINTPFKAFAAGMKEDNPNVTSKEISDAWQASETQKIQERYPTKVAIQTIPGLVYDRRSGEFAVGKLPENLTVADLSSVKADVSALNTLTTREQLIDSFVRRIDVNIPIVKDLATRINNRDNRLYNVPINTLKGMIGSGDLNSLQLALRAISNEVAKVESGSLGIAEVSTTQAEAMARIHDPNLSIADLEIVLATTKQLGDASKVAITQQRADLVNRIDTTIQPGKNPAKTIRFEDLPE